MFYYSKIKRFGIVPWYSETMGTADEEPSWRETTDVNDADGEFIEPQFRETQAIARERGAGSDLVNVLDVED